MCEAKNSMYLFLKHASSAPPPPGLFCRWLQQRASLGITDLFVYRSVMAVISFYFAIFSQHTSISPKSVDTAIILPFSGPLALPVCLPAEEPNKRTLDIFPQRHLVKSRVFMIGPPAARNESCERSAWKHCDLLTREKHTGRPIFFFKGVTPRPPLGWVFSPVGVMQTLMKMSP